MASDQTVDATVASPRLIAFPKSGIAYNECLYEALRQRGVDAIDGDWSATWLFRFVRRGDVIHLHWPSFYYYDRRSQWRTCLRVARFVTILALLKWRGVKFAWTVHNLYPHEGGSALLVHRLMRRYVVRLSSAIFVHGPSAANLVVAEFPAIKTKCVMIKHGHWIDRYPPAPAKLDARTQSGLDPDAYVYCFLGSCRPYKNLELLISSFTNIEGNARLLIAGIFAEAAYKQHIEQLIATTDPARIRLVARYLEDSEISQYAAACDAIVLSYREILTSGAAFLGLSFGRPVIAPRIGGLVDVIDDSCGVLYDPDSPEGLTAGMREAMTRQFSAAGIIERARTFSWDGAASALCGMLRNDTAT